MGQPVFGCLPFHASDKECGEGEITQERVTQEGVGGREAR